MRDAARLEPHLGELILGGTVVAIADAGTRGELRVGGAVGPVLRPVGFGERTRAVARAAGSSSPRDGVSAALLRAATVEDGQLDRVIAEIAALLLAGAGDRRPPFTATLLRVAQGAGWTPAQIAEAEAAEIDRLAAALGEPPVEEEWSRLMMAPPMLDELRDELADALLARMDLPLRARAAEATAVEPVDSFAGAAPARAEWPPAAVDPGRGDPSRTSSTAPVASDMPWQPLPAMAMAPPVAQRPSAPPPMSPSPRASVAPAPMSPPPGALLPAAQSPGALLPAAQSPGALSPGAPSPRAQSPSAWSPASSALAPDGRRLPATSMLCAARASSGPRSRPSGVVADFSVEAQLAEMAPPAPPPVVAPVAEPAATELDIADALAQLLDEESDLRGLSR